MAVALSGIGESGMSAAGWVAMLLGIVLTLGLGLGLMAWSSSATAAATTSAAITRPLIGRRSFTT